MLFEDLGKPGADTAKEETRPLAPGGLREEELTPADTESAEWKQAMNQLSREAAGRGEELSGLVLEHMETEPNIRLEVTLAVSDREDIPLRAGLRAGEKKYYVIKDIPGFLKAYFRKEEYAFGKGFVYDPSWMRFSEKDKQILDFFRRLVSAYEMGKWTVNGAEARLLRMPPACGEELLNLLRENRMRVVLPSGETVICDRIREIHIPIHFDMRLTPRGLSLTSSMTDKLISVTEDRSYVIYQNKLIRTEENQKSLIRFLEARQRKGRVMFDYSLKDTGQVVGEILPWLKLRASVEMGEELRRMLVQLPLKAKLYFDRDNSAVVAQVVFQYGNTELNPFGRVREKIALDKGEKLLMRDAEAEHQVLDILANAGFRVNASNIRLTGQDEIYDFITEGVQKLQGLCEVYLSREFRKMSPRRARLVGGMRMEGESLVFGLRLDGEPAEDTLGIIEALSRRRKYYRLKDGSFLELSGLAEWEESADVLLEAAVRDGAELDRSEITLRGYRAAYLLGMLEEKGVQVETDAGVRETRDMITGRISPEAPEVSLPLRDYQRRGYEWLYTLDKLHMGGVLADDMGLGKTIQVIALLRAVREQNRTSLIVAPTSLTYNWLSEINRFAPELSAAVVNGNIAQRTSLLRHITENGDVDALITSYPLIRRDIDLVSDYRFRLIILDEAQNIKNAGSIASAAVKRLKGDTRLALTGTPMENGVGELWSIFDFVLPGYLPGYHNFLRRYQEGAESEDLRARIRPFLTRRLKQDVLTELPDKIETRLTAQMTPEQKNVYEAAMMRLRPKVNRLIEEKGLGRGRIEVLSAITELREICCHPSLVLDGYTGSSGKLELLLEMLPDMIRSGRRMLIFSQFTSMLKLIRPRLEERGWETMYLDGETPPGERLEMTEKFNRGDVPLFLISLRAGGSGLNLTGADVVIHYDPWWNPATEDQATDRAHRIGQTKKVDVIRLVMGESIEEQVVELGSRKKALFDQLITPGESSISALSEQDIRSLFS